MLTVALATLRTRWTTLIGTFVALALGAGLIAAMGLGLASTFDTPDRAPQRFAGSPVVVMGDDTLTVEVRRGPSTTEVSAGSLIHSLWISNFFATSGRSAR